ncbi:MAG: DMT family transporter [Clostridiales bacterium]|nr:MAG: DMT family transporter [Clostridiales bacterium]
MSFAVINTALPYMLYTKGLERIEASKAIIICCVEPVVATILGVLVLKQSVGFISALGMLFVFAAIAILNIKFEHKTVLKEDTNCLNDSSYPFY